MNADGSIHGSVEAFFLKENGPIPNNPEHPVLLYTGILKSDINLADAFEERFRRNGWTGIWRWGVYGFHHYHSNAHEALGIARGTAELCLGGKGGKRVAVQAGDLLVLPAGTGHKNESSSRDFMVVGAYPPGQSDYDLIRDEQPLSDELLKRVAQTGIPERDPFYGLKGPLTDKWGETERQ